MRYFMQFVYFLIFMMLASATLAGDKVNIPILCYHNLSMIPGSMNMTPEKFESQIKYIKDSGYTIIPLKEAVEYLQGKRDSLPKKAIVITADDGWKSDYIYMLPIIKKYNIPVTLFIYPETISEGKNALTWDQLKQMQQTGLIDIQGHTWDHPNFKHAQKQMSPAKYDNYVKMQLVKSKKELEDKLNIKVSYLAWPFGIYNDNLEKQAEAAGYDMAFTIDALPANRSHRPMAQPRYMIIDALSTKTFDSIVHGANS